MAVANRRKVRVITVDLKGSLMKNVTAVELLLGVAAFAGNAWAIPITIDLSGTIDRVDTSNASASGITIGTPFTITVNYNADDANVNGGNCNATSCIYDFWPTPDFIQVAIGGFTADFDSGYYQNISTAYTSYDSITLNAGNYTGQYTGPSPDVAGEFGMSSVSQDLIEINFQDNTGTALSSPALPENPDLSLFSSQTFAYAVDGSNGTSNSSVVVHGVITAESETTPEPASAPLCLIAVLAGGLYAGAEWASRRRVGR